MHFGELATESQEYYQSKRAWRCCLEELNEMAPPEEGCEADAAGCSVVGALDSAGLPWDWRCPCGRLMRLEGEKRQMRMPHSEAAIRFEEIIFVNRLRAVVLFVLSLAFGKSDPKTKKTRTMGQLTARGSRT